MRHFGDVVAHERCCIIFKGHRSLQLHLCSCHTELIAYNNAQHKCTESLLDAATDWVAICLMHSAHGVATLIQQLPANEFECVHDNLCSISTTHTGLVWLRLALEEERSPVVHMALPGMTSIVKPFKLPLCRSHLAAILVPILLIELQGRRVSCGFLRQTSHLKLCTANIKVFTSGSLSYEAVVIISFLAFLW